VGHPLRSRKGERSFGPAQPTEAFN